MTVERTVELEGHIIDSGTMGRCFGLVMDMGGSFEVEEFRIGRQKDEESYCRLTVSADTAETLASIVHELHQNGATPTDPVDATLEAAPADRTVPTGFYSTTNHPTAIRYGGEWLPIENIEMDCAVVVEPAAAADTDVHGEDGSTDAAAGSTDEREADRARARTKPLSAIEAGDLVVTGEAGIRVDPPDRPRDGGGVFGFMQGGVSAERPSTSRIERIARVIEETSAADGTVLVVAGPAVIHTGAGPALARLVRSGYVDELSVGNGFAVHDVERSMYGTSLGVDVESLEHPRKGHKHHIYAISEVIRAGSIAAAVDAGLVEDGVMYECVTNDVPYVIAGSIRDDGPLPDTITDAVAAQNAIRDQAHRADLVVMLSSLLHSVAVGNCLPSTTRVICVDIDPSTVTQLLDRGSSQAVGMVTDVGTFLPLLADALLETDE
jgi:lysine-ketoglutarate reductase/saccharopine dehydrogenase-like protein (TIGR00300 family)